MMTLQSIVHDNDNVQMIVKGNFLGWSVICANRDAMEVIRGHILVLLISEDACRWKAIQIQLVVIAQLNLLTELFDISMIVCLLANLDVSVIAELVIIWGGMCWCAG